VGEGLLRPPGGGSFENETQVGTTARYLAILLLPAMLTACQTDDAGTIFLASDDGANQPVPANYRPEILAFMHTYLNNPVGVREAAIAEPVQRTVGGRPRYVVCLRFAERQMDGTYRDVRERGVLFINGRLDRMLPNASDECAGAVYRPFPDMEKMQR
jgi:hypothetical protein